MCARRFLIVVFVLTLLAVAAAFAIFQYGGNVLLKQATPKGHFEAAAAGSGPDYSQQSSWVARPGMARNPSLWLPAGVTAGPPGAASVFYIHPTTYLERDRWNAPLDAAGQTGFRTRLFVQSQASAFNAAGEIWAPRYRQAAYGAFLLESEDAKKALDLAYSDVRAAFDHFLSQMPEGEPIILAAHSQGALHLMRLLQERRQPAQRPDRRRLCRRLADQHHRRPSLARLPGLRLGRPGGLHPVLDELRRSRQPRPDPRPMAKDQGADRTGPRGARTFCASIR